MKKSKTKKIIIKLILVLLLLFNNYNITNANILDNLLKIVGISENNKNDDTTEVEEITNDLYSKLNESQKEIVDVVDDIHTNIKELNIDKVLNSLDYKFSNQDIANIKQFLNDYPNAKNNLKSIFNTIKYQIENIYNGDNIVNVRISYMYPKIESMIKSVLPELLLKNAGAIISNEINNDVLDSLFEIINNKLEKGNFEKELNTRTFSFKKINGLWKITNFSDMVNDATSYINSIR